MACGPGTRPSAVVRSSLGGDTVQLNSTDISVRLREYSDLLQAMPLFEGVASDSIGCLLGNCRERICRSGEIILSPERPNEEMYVLLCGAVSIHLESEDNPPLTTLRAGQCVGEMSLFDGMPPSAFVKVVEPSVMLVIHQKVLWEIVDNSHEVARNLLRLLSHRLRASNAAMAEIQHQKQRHQREATRDGLTGLHNRRWLDDLAESLKGDALVSYLPLSVVMVDVDHFKRLNDDLGHQAGDATLRAIAELLRESVRPGDMVARYGGEEFILLLPKTRRIGALALAERLRLDVESHQTSFNDELLPAVTISAGVSCCSTVRCVQEIIQQADAALYRAKRAGRNRVCE